MSILATSSFASWDSSSERLLVASRGLRGRYACLSSSNSHTERDGRLRPQERFDSKQTSTSEPRAASRGRSPIITCEDPSGLQRPCNPRPCDLRADSSGDGIFEPTGPTDAAFPLTGLAALYFLCASTLKSTCDTAWSLRHEFIFILCAAAAAPPPALVVVVALEPS